MLEYVISGLLTLIVGLISLFVDPKTQKKKAWWVVAALLVSSTITAAYGYHDSNNAKTQAEKDSALVQQTADNETKVLNQQQAIQADEQVMKGNVQSMMVYFGLPSQEESEGSSGAAEVPAVKAEAVRNQAIVEYFAKDADSDKIANSLRETGLEIVRVPGQLTGASNAVWYGHSVTVADVKAVALALMQAGNQLQAIKPLAKGTGSKARLIEVGRSEKFKSQPAWTEKQVQSLTLLPRR